MKNAQSPLETIYKYTRILVAEEGPINLLLLLEEMKERRLLTSADVETILKRVS